MTINRKYLAIFVFLAGMADVAITLIGQPAGGIIEDDPLGRMLLTVGPAVFFLLLTAFHAITAWITYKAPAWIALIIAGVMFASASVAVVFWLAILGLPIETLSSAIYFLPLAAMMLWAAAKLWRKS